MTPLLHNINLNSPRLANRILTIALLVLISAPCFAQTPQFKKKSHPAVVGYFAYLNPTIDTTPARKFQMIYEPKYHFPTAPRGQVKAIYLRNGVRVGTRLDNPGYAYNVKMSLGWTRRKNFNRLSQADTTLRDTFITGLTPVYSTPVIRQNIKDSALRWMRFPLTGNFFYEPSQEGVNLVVEVAFGPPYVNNYFCLWDSGGSNGRQLLAGYRDSLYAYSTLRDPAVFSGSSVDFGFDIAATGIESGVFSGNCSLYPNPARGGFHIGLDGPHPYQDLTVTVRNVTGQAVYRQQYQPGTPSFDTEVRLPDVAPGIYLVELVADGERLMRRMQLE